MNKKQYGIPLTLLFMILSYFLSAIGALVFVLFLLPVMNSLIPDGTIATLIYFGFIAALIDILLSLWFSNRKRFNPVYNKIKAWYVLIVFAVFTVIFSVEEASLLSSALILPVVLVFPLFPLLLILSLFGTYNAIIVLGIMMLSSLAVYLVIKKQWKLSIISGLCLICAGISLFVYFNSPNYKYRNQNHGFEYMGGYSSTDFTDYHVYSENSKLITLDHEPDFIIENPEDMPVLDGAEACYPVYAAVAKTLYKEIDQIELSYKETNYGNENGTIVTFYNTAVGFERLVRGDVDMFFGAKPSASQQQYAEEHGVELIYTPIGKEAFVFFVEEDNPVDSLTVDQIRSIYHGSITNWKEVGGNNEEMRKKLKGKLTSYKKVFYNKNVFR